MATLNPQPAPKLSIISWNCLADCYCQGSFSRRLPDPTLLRWPTRFRQISQILQLSHPDILCLQEVDHYHSHYKPFLESLNYIPFYLQRTGRNDGVLIAVNPRKFDVLLKDSVQFDDLANLPTSRFSNAHRDRFRRQNVALILLLRVKQYPSLLTNDSPPRYLTVCNTHLFWNPTMPDVKIAQTRYLLERITFIRQANGMPPSTSILAGDFNSLPQSDIYNLIRRGISFPTFSGKCHVGAAGRAHGNVSSLKGEDGVLRFVCDDSLVRLARMLRLLGLDAALYDSVSGKKWTREKACLIFARARSEKRILVTTNTWLVKRAECPETFLIKSPPDRENLERGLAEMLKYYDVKLDRADILSACAKCGGRIEECAFDDPRLDGGKFPTDRQLLICARCDQVYWESGSCNGPSKKARKAAERLFAIVQKCRESKKKGAQKNGCNSEIADAAVKDCDCPIQNVSKEESEAGAAADELADHSDGDQQKYHCLKYTSAFWISNGEEPCVTNINGDFRGTLDYIFVAGAVKVLDSSIVNCISDSDSNPSNSYPNHEWPSDHMMLKATVELSREAVGRPSLSRTMSSPL